MGVIHKSRGFLQYFGDKQFFIYRFWGQVEFSQVVLGQASFQFASFKDGLKNFCLSLTSFWRGMWNIPVKNQPCVVVIMTVYPVDVCVCERAHCVVFRSQSMLLWAKRSRRTTCGASESSCWSFWVFLLELLTGKNSRETTLFGNDDDFLQWGRQYFKDEAKLAGNRPAHETALPPSQEPWRWWTCCWYAWARGSPCGRPCQKSCRRSWPSKRSIAAPFWEPRKWRTRALPGGFCRRG